MRTPIGADFGPGTTGFHGVGGDAGDGEFQLRYVCGSGQICRGCLGVAALPKIADVVGIVVPHHRCSWFHGRDGVSDQRQFIVVDHYRLGSLEARGTAFRNNQYDRFANEPNPVAHQQRPVSFRRRSTIGPRKPETARNRFDIGQVVSGVDRDNPRHATRGSDVDAGNPGMRMMRAEQNGMQHVGPASIRRVIPATGQKSLILTAPNRF